LDTSDGESNSEKVIEDPVLGQNVLIGNWESNEEGDNIHYREA